MTLRDADYYAGRDLPYPTRPSKPFLPKDATPTEVRAYADALEAYNEAMVTYRDDMDAYNAGMRLRQSDLHVDLAAEYDLTPGQTAVIFSKAWEDGHSGGITEVINLFDELVDMVSRFNQAD